MVARRRSRLGSGPATSEPGHAQRRALILRNLAVDDARYSSTVHADLIICRTVAIPGMHFYLAAVSSWYGLCLVYCMII